MKTKTLKKCIAVIAAIAAATGAARAQSSVYVYPDVQSGYSIAQLPGTTDYIATGTVYDPSGDNKIHFMRYDKNGLLLVSVLWDQANFDDRSLKVLPINANRVLVLAYSEKAGTPEGAVHLIVSDENGVIGIDQKIGSSEPAYPSLMPVDATINLNTGIVAVCGTASLTSQPQPADDKRAFVMTTDLSSFVNMQFYDSPNGGGTFDFDIASRIVETSSGDYYVTGSQNVLKTGMTTYTMGVRNMKINSGTLNFIWSTPIYATYTGRDNGVDMAEVNNEYCVLINRADDETWCIMRVSPSSGLPTALPGSEVEQFSQTHIRAHRFIRNDRPNELIVAGTRPELKTGSCTMYTPTDAAPFLTILDMANFPASVGQTATYPTIGGTHNSTFTVNYWDIGDFYAPINLYQASVYLNNMAEALIVSPGSPVASFGIVTPLMDPTQTFLNNKFVFANSAFVTSCDANYCNESMYIPAGTATYTGVTLFPDPRNAAMEEAATSVNNYMYMFNYNCPTYYRPGSSTTGIGEAAADGKSMLYPNPAFDKIFIDADAYSGSHLKIVLTGIDGKAISNVYEGVAPGRIEYTLPNGLAKGIYLVKITAEGKAEKTEKLVIK